MNKLNKIKNNPHRSKKWTHLFITLRIYPWAGTVSPFLTGSINCMVSAYSINVKYAVTIVTGEEEPSKCISKNGDILTV